MFLVNFVAKFALYNSREPPLRFARLASAKSRLAWFLFPMPFTRAGQLARSVIAARATDPIGLVAENLRMSQGGVIPVLDRATLGEVDPNERNARVLGLISQNDLSRATRNLMAPVAQAVAQPVAVYANGADIAHQNGNGTINGDGHSSHAAGVAAVAADIELHQAELTAADIMRSDVPYIPANFSLHNALLTLDRYDLPAMPVYDDARQYLGMVSRADLLAGVHQSVRPPLVGGMATPLGVWLTDGRYAGGAPNLGLFLTGLILSVGLMLSTALIVAGAWALRPEWGAMAYSGRLGAAVEPSNLFNTVTAVIQSFLFLMFFRVLPLSGVHAAEHQTVWALERGLPLTIENVRSMPRAHPRCGTNLVALGGLLTIGIQHLPEITPNWILVVFIAAFFGWRNLGTALQTHFMTRPATDAQIEGGIRAANEVMAKYQAQPTAAAPLPLRLLNNGMIWSAAGMVLGLFVLDSLLSWVMLQIAF